MIAEIFLKATLLSRDQPPALGTSSHMGEGSLTPHHQSNPEELRFQVRTNSHLCLSQKLLHPAQSIRLLLLSARKLFGEMSQII
jgi:hypothetical protein